MCYLSSSVWLTSHCVRFLPFLHIGGSGSQAGQGWLPWVNRSHENRSENGSSDRPCRRGELNEQSDDERWARAKGGSLRPSLDHALEGSGAGGGVQVPVSSSGSLPWEGLWLLLGDSTIFGWDPLVPISVLKKKYISWTHPMLVEFGELKHGALSEILRKEAIQLGPQHTEVRYWTVSLTHSFTNASDINYVLITCWTRISRLTASRGGRPAEGCQPHNVTSVILIHEGQRAVSSRKLIET